jgi:hypothetical protein
VGTFVQVARSTWRPGAERSIILPRAELFQARTRIMRRLVLILAVASAAFAQTITPSIDLNVPVPGTVSWGLMNPIRYTLNRYWSGGELIPGFDLPIEGDTHTSLRVYNPAACGTSQAPSWCSGSDIGAWTNSAIAALPASAGGGGTSAHCGEVFIPAGAYRQTTTIIVPRCVKLHGSSSFGTVLSYTPTTGQAIIVADSTGTSAFGPAGAIEDLTLLGPGASTTTVAIYIGGSDSSTGAPSTSVDPSTNYGDNFSINRIRTMEPALSGSFGVGIQWGNNAWNTNIFQSTIAENGVNLFFPDTNTNSGERINVNSSLIGNATGICVKLGNITASMADFHFINSGIDYCRSWAIQNGTGGNGLNNHVSFEGGHIEQSTHWIQNFGIMTVAGAALIGGRVTSGQYLIDNEFAAFVMTGGEILAGGGGVVFNSSGTCPIISGTYTNIAFGCYLSWSDQSGDVIAGKFVGTTASGGNPLSLSSRGTFLGWNYTGGKAEADFFNNYSTGGGMAVAFNWYANISGTPSLLATLLANGVLGSKLLVANQGTSQTARNIALGNGWGSGCGTAPTISAVSGYSQTEQFTITSGSSGCTYAAGPTVTISFPNPFQTTPVCSLDVHAITGSGGAIIFNNTTPSTTAPVFTAYTITGIAFTPAASETYTVVLRCGP